MLCWQNKYISVLRYILPTSCHFVGKLLPPYWQDLAIALAITGKKLRTNHLLVSKESKKLSFSLFHVFSEIHRRYARFPLEELPERRLVGKVEGCGYLLYG